MTVYNIQLYTDDSDKWEGHISVSVPTHGTVRELIRMISHTSLVFRTINISVYIITLCLLHNVIVLHLDFCKQIIFKGIFQPKFVFQLERLPKMRSNAQAALLGFVTSMDRSHIQWRHTVESPPLASDPYHRLASSHFLTKKYYNSHPSGVPILTSHQRWIV